MQTINTRKYLTESSAHVLGYLGEVNKEKIKLDQYYNKGDLYGVKGIEAGYEKQLRGKKECLLHLSTYIIEHKEDFKKVNLTHYLFLVIIFIQLLI